MRELEESDAQGIEFLYDKTIKLADKTLVKNQSSVAAHQYLSMAWLHKGNEEKSLYHLGKAVTLQPNDINVVYTSALVYNKIGETQNALAAIDKLLASGYSSKLVISDPALKNLLALNEMQLLLAQHP